MPSLGPWLGVNSGSDGDDWKWRNVLGRVRDGVAGIASLDGRLPFAGVFIVSPSALGLLLCGGVGGLTKDGDAGADVLSLGGFAPGAGPLRAAEGRARGAPIASNPEVETARFLRLRAFF